MTFYGVASGYYKPLSVKEVESIHQTSLRILAEVGFMVENDRALQVLSEIGCTVDNNRKIVKVEPDLLMRTIKQAPARITLYGREEKNTLVIEANRTYYSNGGTAIKTIDLETGERRDSNLEDVGQICKVIDALEHTHMIMLPIYPAEHTPDEVDVNRFFTALNNSTKHVMGGLYGPEGAKNVIKMAQIIAGGEDALRRKPILTFITCLLSPLKMEHNYVNFMFDAAEAGIPVITSVCPISGLTAPMTLAGHLAQLNAEALSGILLLQAIKPGTPVFYSVVPTIADMRSMSFLFGSVESGIMNAACAQLASYYNMPMYSTGGVSEAKTGDAQAGYEKAISSLMPALAGAQLIHDAAGLLEGSIVFSLEQLIIDDEINGMALRSARGIEVNEDTLAFETIKNVGPGGNYLAETHTVKHMRSETFFPKVANRSIYADWVNDGAKTSWDRANDLAKDILANHYVEPFKYEIIADLIKEFPRLRVLKF
ncbi:MAG: trimethylamine methyltransferase family protein [Bacillota bacterium]|nr:trimethylamine methyltransferase family protein [Bacillota bacterium]